MNRNIALFIAFFCTVATITIVALAADPLPPKTGPGEAMARMVKLGEELATPNESHAFIQKLCGSWITSSTLMNLPAEQGSARYKMVLGNRFLEGEHDGSFAGVPYVGHMVLGYDKYKHKFVATYYDNLGTSMRYAEGLLDRSKKVLSLWGTQDEWMTDEHDKPILYRYRLIDADHYTLEIHDLGITSGDPVVIKVHFERMAKE